MSDSAAAPAPSPRPGPRPGPTGPIPRPVPAPPRADITARDAREGLDLAPELARIGALPLGERPAALAAVQETLRARLREAGE